MSSQIYTPVISRNRFENPFYYLPSLPWPEWKTPQYPRPVGQWNRSTCGHQFHQSRRNCTSAVWKIPSSGQSENVKHTSEIIRSLIEHIKIHWSPLLLWPGIISLYLWHLLISLIFRCKKKFNLDVWIAWMCRCFSQTLCIVIKILKIYCAFSILNYKFIGSTPILTVSIVLNT